MDGEPAEIIQMAHGPAPEEPKTPSWLPALGAALFLAAGIAWMTTREEPKPAPAEPAPAADVADAGPG